MREILIWIAVAVILALLLAAADREQPFEPKDPSEPQTFDEDEFE